jgi:small subunit ribosomal protein S16
MSVQIRLSRQGAKKQPNYLVVAVDSAKKRDGAYLAKLGQYFPKAANTKDKLKIDLAALQAWQAKGARMTQTVGQLVKKLAQ